MRGTNSSGRVGIALISGAVIHRRTVAAPTGSRKGLAAKRRSPDRAYSLSANGVSLLKRRAVTHGVFVRSDRPVEQAADVVRRLDLADRLAPFTRCLRSNGELASVPKADVAHRLEPLTRRYYHEFHRCTRCDRIYWRGSHHPRLEALIEAIRAGV